MKPVFQHVERHEHDFTMLIYASPPFNPPPWASALPRNHSVKPHSTRLCFLASWGIEQKQKPVYHTFSFKQGHFTCSLGAVFSNSTIKMSSLVFGAKDTVHENMNMMSPFQSLLMPGEKALKKNIKLSLPRGWLRALPGKSSGTIASQLMRVICKNQTKTISCTIVLIIVCLWEFFFSNVWHCRLVSWTCPTWHFGKDNLSQTSRAWF